MFQLAQEEVDAGNYENALRYYDEFIRRNPDDRGSIMEAEYERAFIAYKQGDYDTAEARFQALLAQYEEPDVASLPEWPRILSNRLLEIIAERREEEGLPLVSDVLDEDEPATSDEVDTPETTE